jgi:soluble lytic murein transglycosylase-like protein
MRLGRSLVVGLFCTVAVWGGQIVKMADGQTLRVERADRDGDQIFLTVASNVTIVSAGDVLSIEAEPDPNKPKAVAKPMEKDARGDTMTLIREAARKHGLPPSIVESIAEVESALRTDAVSHKGAIGVMQLMPGTARQLGVDPHDVAQNIEGGTRYLRELLLKYRNDPNQVALALAAYNAGPGAVQRYQGVPPYQETQKYVRKVLNRFDRKSAETQ